MAKKKLKLKVDPVLDGPPEDPVSTALEPVDPFYVLTITVDRNTGGWSYDLGGMAPSQAISYLEAVKSYVWDGFPDPLEDWL